MASGGAVLTIVGGAVFGPAGALVGGILGDVLFPPEPIEGPRLNELNFQQSTVGAPIPLVYGTASLAGNVIWSGGLIETKHEDEQGGFLGFGGQKFTSYTYSVDVAVGICEGPISGIRRIWADADLIYDASDDETLTERLELVTTGSHIQDLINAVNAIRAMSAQLEFEQYLGSEDQLPDPTIEIYEGVGLVPAYRGLAYVVFREFQLEKYGNRIPNFRFEVYSGAPTECGIYSPGTLYPWYFQLPGSYAAMINDPRNPANTHVYSTSAGSPLQEQETFALAEANMRAAFNDRNFRWSNALGPEYADNIYIQGWSPSGSPNWFLPCEEHYARAEYVTVYMNINSVPQLPSERYACAGAGGPTWYANKCDMPELDYRTTSFYDGATSGFYARTDDGEPLPEGYFDGTTTAQGVDGIGDCGGDEPTQQWYLSDRQVAVSRTLQPPDPCMFGTPLVGAPGWCVVNGQVTKGITWTLVSGTFAVLQEYAHTGAFGIVTQYPVGPCLRSDDPNYNNQAFWEAAYAAAVAAGEPLVVDPVYGTLNGYPSYQNYAYFSECDTVDTECVPMAVIVADLCRRAGLT